MFYDELPLIEEFPCRTLSETLQQLGRRVIATGKDVEYKVLGVK